MKLKGIELIRGSLSMKEPFRTSFGVMHERDLLLVRAVSDDADGWGECIATALPNYSPEYADGAAEVLGRFLVPLLLAQPNISAERVAEILKPIKGHRMAKCALEAAVLDMQLRARKESLARYLGAVHDRVPAGVSIGIRKSIPELLDVVSGFLEEGYSRIKLKIAPGWDIEPMRAVREHYGEDFPIQVDANAAYTLADAHHIARFDDFNLLLLEQPLGEEDLRQHSELARMIRTPIALDESITSAAAAADAIALGACRVINIKPGRVGGYLESRRIHDLARAHGLAVWCGGMAETGIGRAANLCPAALPGFIPGDTSASSRYYTTNLTPPFELRDGHLDVPTGPGFGVEPDRDAISAITTSTRWLPA